jgi:hypothetical protein
MTKRSAIPASDLACAGPGSSNFLFITYDSCRWDTFARAATPVLDSLTAALPAFAQATFTYAAHLAMLQGILPHAYDRLPFYNRYVRQLIRIRHRPTKNPSLISFPGDTPDIVTGFRRCSYYTLCLGAMEWFHHPHLRDPFEDFVHTGIHTTRQIELFRDHTSRTSRPFFALLNFGETHDPYRFSLKRVWPSRISRARYREPASCEFDHLGWNRQIRCCEYLDQRLGDLVVYLRTQVRPTVVVVCGDHGECFGEDGLFGHGFYHPKIMSVPLAIFEINGEQLRAVQGTPDGDGHDE